MRMLFLLPCLALGACTLGEAAGLYDLPAAAVPASAAFPALLTQEEIARRGLGPLDPVLVAGEVAAADALAAEAEALLARELEALTQRAGRLRGDSAALPRNPPGVSAAGRSLLARAASLRARAGATRPSAAATLLRRAAAAQARVEAIRD